MKNTHKKITKIHCEPHKNYYNPLNRNGFWKNFTLITFSFTATPRHKSKMVVAWTLCFGRTLCKSLLIIISLVLRSERIYTGTITRSGVIDYCFLLHAVISLISWFSDYVIYSIFYLQGNYSIDVQCRL